METCLERFARLNSETKKKRKQMKGSPDRIQACTTTHFDGSIAVVDPEKSWVARWQRTSASSFFFFFVCAILDGWIFLMRDEAR